MDVYVENVKTDSLNMSTCFEPLENIAIISCDFNKLSKHSATALNPTYESVHIIIYAWLNDVQVFVLNNYAK